MIQRQESSNPFAEVIESSLHTFKAQSWQWDYFPPFGSLVSSVSSGRTIIGIVYQMSTGSMDPGRTPFAYKKTHAQLLAEQPQIFEFLKTTFDCVTIGYEQEGTVRYLVAPEPPAIHSFITPLALSSYKSFLAETHYIQILFAQAGLIGCIDELLLALLVQQQRLNLLTSERIATFIEYFNLLTGNDYRRLKLFLQRAQQILTL